MVVSTTWSQRSIRSHAPEHLPPGGERPPPSMKMEPNDSGMPRHRLLLPPAQGGIGEKNGPREEMPLAPGHTAIAGGGPGLGGWGAAGRVAKFQGQPWRPLVCQSGAPGSGAGPPRCGPLGRAVRSGGSEVVPGGRDVRASPERGCAAPRRRSAPAQSNYRGSGAGSRLCPGPGGGAPGAAGAGHPAQPLPPSPLSSPRAWRRPAALARLRGGPLLFPAAGRPAIGPGAARARAAPAECHDRGARRADRSFHPLRQL